MFIHDTHSMAGANMIFYDGSDTYTFVDDVYLIDPVACPFMKFPSNLGCEVWKHWKISMCCSTRQMDIDPAKPKDGP
jgi:hypothetical protein